jgi:hypothetical protein
MRDQASVLQISETTMTAINGGLKGMEPMSGVEPLTY